MIADVPAVDVVVFGLAMWLGMYLLARDVRKPRLRYAGLGLVAYALGLASDNLGGYAVEIELANNIARFGRPLLFLPALLWSAALIDLLPEAARSRGSIARLWGWGLLPLMALVLVLGTGRGGTIDAASGGIRPGPTFYVGALTVVLPLVAAFAMVVRGVLAGQSDYKRPLGVLLVTLIFFGLGTGLLIFPLNWMPRQVVILAIGADLIVLGLVIAVLDAFDEGETLLPDMMRSFDYSFIAVLVFSGQVLLVIVLATGLTFAMLALLLATMTVSIVTQTFANQLQALIDGIVFGSLPEVRQGRAELRAAASALPRVGETLNPHEMDEEEFVRLTRRALSHFGDLPRLAASPLTRMPLVERRLEVRGASRDTLERAAELKALLGESVERLKPRDKGDFGSSDEWRYYNALYFPYVLGLRPFSRRASYDGLDAATREALDWFRAYVPERTLFNWQNAAARLVARDLLERDE